MNKIKTTILLAVILLFLAGTASAGISVSPLAPLTPGSDTVAPGGIAKYVFSVSLVDNTQIDPSQPNEIVTLINPSDAPPGWTYTFTPNNFEIVPGGEVTVNLDVGVAGDTALGTYIQHGDVSTTDTIFGIADYETTTYVVDTNVVIPEFPTVALPIASVIGLMLMFHKRKQN